MPAEMDEILKHAETLGQMVSEQPATAKYKQAQKAVSDDSEARSAISDFNRMLESLARQEQQGLAITDAQKLSLQSLQERIVSNIKIKALNMAEVEFTDMLRKVSQAWQKPLGVAMGGAAAAGMHPGEGGGASPVGPRIVGAR
jgi:cell fate (sporulation/competence/biofilm development) regulator YlbF (YheA/YmcA/DUF963 family)